MLEQFQIFQIKTKRIYTSADANTLKNLKLRSTTSQMYTFISFSCFRSFSCFAIVITMKKQLKVPKHVNLKMCKFEMFTSVQ